MINWDLLKHPVNWAIVILMLTIAGAAGHLLLTHFGAQPEGPEQGLAATGARRGPTRADYARAALGE